MTDPTDIEAFAKEAAGNWQKFEKFIWWRRTELSDGDNWTIITTHHRDSGLLARSNAAAFQIAFEPFTLGDNPDVVFEHHYHWAVGVVYSFSLRVYRRVLTAE